MQKGTSMSILRSLHFPFFCRQSSFTTRKETLYYSIGHIDEKALENMSLVLSLSNSICTKKGQEDDSDMGKYFPYFYWVLRDFSLDLKGKSEKEYLDECLKPISTNDKDPKNQIRAKLNKFFPYRTCECFPRPLTDEKRLAHIE